MINVLGLIIFLVIVIGLICLMQFYIYCSYRRWFRKAILPNRQRIWRIFGIVVLIFGNLFFLMSSFTSRSGIFNISLITSLISYIGGLFFTSILVAFCILVLKDILVLFISLTNKALKSVKGFSSREVSDLKEAHNLSRRLFLKTCGVTTIIATSGAPVLALFKTTSDYKIVKQSLSFHNFPKGLNGLTIAQISDIHAGVFMKNREIAEVFHMVNALNADMIVITGDFVDRDTIDFRALSHAFKTLKSDLGVYGCLGNHDHYTGAGKINNMLEGSDVFMLNNENKILQINKEPLSIIGVDYFGRSMHRGDYADLNKAMKTVKKDTFKILLSHNPEFFSKAKEANIDLTLAGHTHGGQIGFNVAGLKINPAYAAFKYPKGLYIEENKQLYVNVGVGTFALPIRTVRPEITLFTLSRKQLKNI